MKLTRGFQVGDVMDRLQSNPQAIELAEKCAACTVKHRAICGALTKDELNQLNKIARRRTISSGQTIMSDEEPADFVGIVTDGVIKLTKTLSDGRQQIVGLQFASDFLGRTYNTQNNFCAEAATEVELCSFPRQDFELMLKKFPELENRLFQNTLDELDAAREWMLLLGRKTAQEKVASLLLMIASRAPNVGCRHAPELEFARFTLPLTRADLADYLCLTLETVSRQITKLKTKGVIELVDNREIIVPDIKALEQVANS